MLLKHICIFFVFNCTCLYIMLMKGWMYKCFFLFFSPLCSGLVYNRWPDHWPSVRVFTNGPGDWCSISGQVMPKTKKIILDTSCLTLSIIRYISRVKWSNPREVEVPSSTAHCSSYWKGSLWVALNYGHQLYFYLVIS